MVKLPDSSNLRRNIPQATSAIQNVPVAMDFQAMQGVGQQLQQTGNRLFAQQQRDALYEQRQQKELLRQQEKQDNEIKKFQIAQAKSQYDIEADNIVASLSEEQDFTKYQTILDNGFKALNERMSESLPDDPIAKGYFELHRNKRYNDAKLETSKLQKQKQGDTIRASVYKFGEDYVQQYVGANAEQQKSLNSNLYSMFYSARDAGVINAEEAEIGINKTRQDAERNRLKSLTPEQVIAETGGTGNGDFNNAISYIFKKEGGYVAKDGRSNAPANFGINKKANPDIDVENLTQEQAKKIYKERYWNKINADSLPENIRLIAFDTAVNQGVDTANKLLKESDGDPETFTKLRIEQYKLLNQPENEKGWINRANETLQQSAPTGQSQYSKLPKAEIFKERERALKEQRKQEIETKTAELTNALTGQTPNLKQQEATLNTYDIDPEIKEKVSLQLYKIDNELKNDAIGFLEKKAMETGQDFDLESAIDTQKQRGVPESRASVLSKNDSQMVTQNLLAVKSVPEMEQWLGGLKQKVGDKYLPQAFRQLVKDGLPKEYKYVLALDPYKDADEMRVMFNGLTADKTEFNNAFKNKLSLLNEKKTDFDNAFNTELESVIDQEIKSRYTDTGTLNNSLKLMAQSHFIQYGDSEKAIQFAKNSYMKNYYNNGGEFYTVDGTPLAIPIDATSDHRFIVDGLEAYKDNNINDIFSIEGRFKEIEQSQKETVMDNAYFALNPQEDGVFLYDEMGLLILNKEKKPIELKFFELTAKQEQNKKSLANIIAKEQAERQARIAEQEKIEENKPIELFGD